jgi:hypothetical protein
VEQHGQTWQIRHVPESVRRAFGSSVRTRYDAVTFRRSEGPIVSAVVPELIAPGHPMLNGLVQTVDEAFGHCALLGVLLNDDRASEDYTLVTVMTGGPDGDAAMQTFAVMEGGNITAVDPALYTSLEGSASRATDLDIHAATQATAVALTHSEGEAATVVAIAHVRGTADAATARAWSTARAQLGHQLRGEHGSEHVVEARPGAGWDYVTDSDGISFVRAIPVDHPAVQRRAEKHAAANVGDAYVESTVGGADT